MFWFAQIYFSSRIRIRCVVLFILMGALIEVLQSFEIERMFEWLDMLANSVGALCAFLLSMGRQKFLLLNLEQRITKNVAG